MNSRIEAFRDMWRSFARFEVGETPLSRLTLRFLDNGLEAGFARARKGRLISMVRLCGLAVCATIAAILGMGMLQQLPDGDIQEAEVMTHVFWVVCGILGVSVVVVALFFALPLVHPEVSPGAVELATVLVIATFLVAHTFAIPWYLAHMMGVDPGSTSIADHANDTSLILSIDVVVTISVLALPIRLHSFFVVPVTGVLCYVVPTFALGGPDMHNAPISALYLTVLTTMAAVGKRCLELQERTLFTNLLKEKGLRFQSEFQLSRVASTLPGVGRGWDQETPPESRVDCGSLPSTTNTERVFTECAGNAHFFQELSPIGVKEQWLVGRAELNVARETVLGEGAFGSVFLGRYQGFAVAVKVAKQGGSVGSKSRVVQICNEVRILRRLRHPNIVVFYGACIDVELGSLALVLELVNGTSLGAFIGARQLAAQDGPRDDVRGPPSEVERAKILTGVSCALRYLHSRTPAVVHGDLKDSNVFVESPCACALPTAKLLDFGLSRVLTKTAGPLGGTPRWAAPEVFQGCPPRAAADVFTFGRLAFFVATGRYPWSQMRRDSIRGKASEREAAQALPWAADSGWLVRRCRRVVEECCMTDPSARPPMKRVHAQAARWLASLLMPAPPTGEEDEVEEELEQEKEEDDDDGKAGGPERGAVAGGGPCGELCSGRGGEPEGSADEGPGKGSGRASHREARAHPGCTLESVPQVAPDIADMFASTPTTRLQGSMPTIGSQENLMEEAFLPTPLDTMVALVHGALCQSNFRRATGSCCRFHAGVQMLDVIRRELTALACRSSRLPIRGQCSECRCLCLRYDAEGPADEPCELCGGRVVPVSCSELSV